MSSSTNTKEMPDTKRRLLEAAMELMLRQGFTATTVDQICSEAKLTKGSFFHYFKSKDEIGEATLDYFCEKQREHFTQAPFMKLTDPLERLYGLLDFFGEAMNGSGCTQGCLMGNLTQELALTHPRMQSCCDEKFADFAGFIQTMLQDAKARHRPQANFEPESVAMFFVSLMQGSLLLTKARQDNSLMLKNLEHFRAYIDTLFGKSRRR